MATVTFQPVVEFKDVSAELGIHMNECTLTHMAERDSYIKIDLSNKQVEELKESIEWEERGEGPNVFSKKYRNDLRVVELLRSLVPCDFILMHIIW